MWLLAVHHPEISEDNIPSKLPAQYIPNFVIFQPNSPKTPGQVSGYLEIAARSPTPTIDAAVWNPASNIVLITTAATNLVGSNAFVSAMTALALLGISVLPKGFGTTTTGEPGGDAFEREGRRRRVAVVTGDEDIEPGVPETIPFTASAGLLLDATLADFVCRLRGAMFATDVLGPVRLEIVGSCEGCTRVVVSSRRSSSIKIARLL